MAPEIEGKKVRAREGKKRAIVDRGKGVEALNKRSIVHRFLNFFSHLFRGLTSWKLPAFAIL